ncbi:iron chelate uptake ABC transporter family permease subunit [Zhihengliuella sp.]|uniref:FecCD family ABC transporter permease n=1 Tax=Zhihengliuella sp. TaxID=1954483 RepID=UPI0028111FA7|nr:iron chelate uptake ABC transporter family permease subunit [Zhihengliuella sp.]
MTAAVTDRTVPALPRPHRGTRVALVLAGVVVVLFLVTVLLGSTIVSPSELLAVLSGQTVPGVSFIVLEDRLPTAFVGALAGAAFALSGTVFQTLLRNPLASPDIIGIGYGAATAAVAGMLVLGLQGPWFSVSAFVGALVVALVVYFLADSGQHTGGRLILMGIGAGAMLHAVMNYLLSSTDVRSAGDALHWLVGSLSNSNWERVGTLAVALAVLAPLTAFAATRLKVLQLGDDAAAGLGVDVARSRLTLVVLGVALAAAATSVTGPIAFVAFLAGPLARLLTGGRTDFLCSALVGSALVLAADFAGSNLFGDTSLPVGVVTGALGAPFLLWLLVRSNQQGMGG